MKFYDNLFACYSILAKKLGNNDPKFAAYGGVWASQTLLLGCIFGIFKQYTKVFRGSSIGVMKVVLGSGMVLLLIVIAIYFRLGDRMNLAIERFSEKSGTEKTFWAIVSALAIVAPPCTYGFLFTGK